MTTPETRPVIQEAPGPWKHCTNWADGGLFQVGYAENSDLLLALSAPVDRFIFNCLTGEILAHDHDEVSLYFNFIRLLAQGFGPLEGKNIRMAGRFGGGLPLTTEDGWELGDGWELEEGARAWSPHSIFLTPPTVEQQDGSLLEGATIVIGNAGDYVLRAYGFSETGRSFVIATSGDLTIFAR